MKKPYLSIIIPAHNEEKRLPPSLAKIDKFLKKQKYSFEVVVVENGSRDATIKVVKDFIKNHAYVRLMIVKTRGKGLAVKQGMLAAKGKYRFICDSDLSMPISELPKFLPPNAAGHDVMIGSREAKGSNRIGEPLKRHLMGRLFNFIIKLSVVRGFEDTQCGFKMFTAKAADELFTIQRLNGIGFDIELIFLAKKRGFKIKEIPITWYFDEDSRMKLFQDSFKALLEIAEIQKNWFEGRYRL